MPKSVTKEEISENLKSQGIENEDVRTVERINGTSKFNTVFVSILDENKRNEIIKNGKIRLGISYFPSKKYEPKKVIQCHKCQRYGHIARICKSIVEVCGNCGENHLTNACSDTGKMKCVNCGDKAPSYHRNCIKKIELEKEIRKKFNIKKKPQKSGVKVNQMYANKKNEQENIKNITENQVSEQYITENRNKINYKNKEIWRKIEEIINRKMEAVIENIYVMFEEKLERYIQKLNSVKTGNPKEIHLS